LSVIFTHRQAGVNLNQKSCKLMKYRSLNLTFAILCVVAHKELSQAQTSELYMIYSPNVISPYGNTYVYQGGHLVRSWNHANPYEVAPAVAGGTVVAGQAALEGGTVRQAALYNPGTEYTLAGVPTGTHYGAIANTYDAASDGNSIYGWNLVTASLVRYDLNWHVQATLFSLGAGYSYTYMGIAYDLQNNSVWLSPWSTGSIDSRGRLYDYSLDGHLLGTLSLANPLSTGNGLAYDPADNTLWFFNWTDQRYEQYSTAGQLLGTMTGMSRIYGAEFAIVPEPSALALLGAVLILRRRCPLRRN